MYHSVTNLPIANREHNCVCISGFNQLKGAEIVALRDHVKHCLDLDCNRVYLDARNVNHTDLSGINEVIHTHYCLSQVNKELVLVYRRNSIIERWVIITQIDLFVKIAILPAA
mgnify:CR=1 FL=1